MYTITSRTKNIQTKYTNQLARELSPNMVTGNIPFLTSGNYGGGGGSGGGTVSNVDLTAVTTNIIPTTNGSQNLGDSSHRFGTTYTNYVDIAGSVIGQIIPASTNGSQNLGSSSNRFGTTYTNNVDICGSIVPATTNTVNIGTSTQVFGNLHIKEITINGNILPPEQNYPARALKLGVGNVILETSRTEVSSAIQVNLGGPDHYFGSLYAKEIFTSGNTISLGGAQLKSEGDSITMPAGSKIGGVDPGTIVIKGNRLDIQSLPNATGGGTNATGDGYVIDGNLWVATKGNSTVSDGWVSVGSFRGPKGDQGNQGIQGIQGNAGPQGSPGIQGNVGPAGAQGAQGPPGVLDTTGATFSGTITMPDLIVTGNSGFGKSTPAYRVDVSGSLNASSIYQNGTLLSSIYATTTTSSLNNYYTKTAIDSSLNGGFYNKAYINTNFYNKETIDATLSDGFYTKGTIDSTLSNNYYNKTAIDATLSDNYYNKTAIDTNLSTNFYNKSAIDTSLNNYFYNKSTADASLNANFYNKRTADASMNASFYNKSTIDASLNTNFYNKRTVDASVNASFYGKAVIDASINASFYGKSVIDASINASFYGKTAIDANYYNKGAIDSSINSALGSYYTKTESDTNAGTVLGSYYTKGVADSSINSVLTGYSKTTALNSYYTKTVADSSVNAVLQSYSTITYVDNAITSIYNVSPATLQTLADISAAMQDASFGVVVYGRLESSDASINSIRADIQTLSTTQDPSINELALYNLTQDAAISALPTKSAVDASLSLYYTKTATDSSINTLVSKYYTKTTVDSSINSLISSYYTKSTTDSSINAILGSYARSSSLNSYYTKEIVDSSINDVLGSYAPTALLDSYYTKEIADSNINTALESYAQTALLDSYYTKTVADSSINSVLGSYARNSALSSYYTKTATDSSINSVLNNFARTATLTTNYYTKTATDTAINTALGSYATVGYVDTQITNFTNVSPTTLNTLNQIAAAVQNDASFVTVVSVRLNSADASINEIRAQIAGVSAAQDPSINQLITYNSGQDATISTMLVKADFDSSMNANYYSRAAVDSSLNANYYSRVTVDASLSRYLLKTGFDSSLNANYYSRTTVDTSLNRYLLKTAFDSSLNANYYSKAMVDGSLNSNFYNKTTLDSVLGSYALSSALNNYYIKSAVDSSINDVLGSYASINYVDGRFTTLTGVAPSQLDTLAEIATALQGDAGFGVNVYNRLSAADSSINTIRTRLSATDSSVNTIRTNLSATDSSVNTIRTNLSGYVTSNDSSVNTIRTNLSGYVTSNDSSVNTIRTNLSGYVTSNDSSVNTIRTNLSATDSSVNTIRTNLSGYVTSTDSSVNTIRTNLSATDSSVNTIRTGLSDYVTSIDASLSAIRTSIQQVSSTGSIQDPSINDLITYNGTQDSTITAISNSLSNYLLKSGFDSSMNANYYTKSVIDGSINSVLGSYAQSSSLSNYYLKADTDSSINSVLGSYAQSSSLTNYYLKTDTDSSINSVLGSYAQSSSLSNYYLKADTDSSINNVLLNYSQGINYQVTNAGAGAYVINNVNNLDITLIRGLTYVFSVNASGHPFWIQTSDGGYNSSNVYNTGITNNGTQSGNITWVVDNTTPNTLYYVCQYHSSMQGQINIVDLSFAPFTYVNNSLNSYYTKTVIDSSLNDNFYNKTTTDSTFLSKSAFDSSMNSNYSTKAATDLSINNVLGSYALSSSLNNYYLKADTDLSINSLLGSYSTTDYVDDRFTTLVGTISTETLDTLAEIANALQGDASFGLTVYGRINSCDSSINTIRTSLSGYATKTAVDASLALYSTKSFIDASLALYSTKSFIDASLALYSTKSLVDASLALYSTKSVIDASLALYSTKSVIDNSLSLYVLTSALTNTDSLQSGTTSDVSFNGNVQLGGGSKFIGINKTPNALYSLDVSGSVYMSNNLDMSGSINAYGIFNNGEVFDSAMDGLSTDTYTSLTAQETLLYPSTSSLSQIAASSDGKYIIASSNSPPLVLLSSNYGATFTDISNSVLGTLKYPPAMSTTGQYIYLPADGNCYSTSNYGVTWVRDTNFTSVGFAVSGSGKYVLRYPSTGNIVGISSNFGSTYGNVDVGSGLTNLRTCAISETGQIMAIGPNSGAVVKISQNFGKTWKTVTTGTGGGASVISLSASGKYILAGSFLSNNFGVSFEPLPSPANQASVYGSTMSANGQYMAISNTNTGFYSHDYGRTWVSRPSTGNNSSSVISSSMSMISNASFIYQATTTGVLRLSASSSIILNSAYIANNLDMSGSINAYGIFNNGDVFDSGMDGLSTDRYTNFFTSESTSHTFVGGTASVPLLAMSNDGKYVLCTAYGGVSPIFLSTNYGVSFTDISNSFLTGTKANRFQCTISPNGKYMFSTGNSASAYYSTDYGATWAEVTNAAGRMYALSYSGKYVVKCTSETTNNIYISSNYGSTYTPVFTGSSRPYPYFAAMSGTGQVIATCEHTASGVKISKNFGKTWTTLSTVGNTFFVAMSASGRYIMAGGNLSTDFGDTFTQPAGLPTSYITGLSVSATGQYMIITNASTSFYSVDYGKTWSNRGTNGTNGTNGTSVAMTANASFVMQATSTGIYKYTSLSEVNASSAYIANNVSINKTLNALYSLDVSGSVYVSNNLDMSGSINAYGIFNNGDVFDSGMDGLSTNMYTNFFTSESRSRTYAGTGAPNVSMSNDGKYILSIYYTGEAYLSTNYGVSFTDISNSTGNQGNRFPVSVSATGKYMFSPGNSTPSYYSTDYGATWAIDLSAGRMAAMSYSGKYIVKCPPDNVYTIKLSSNYGATYTTVTVGSSLPLVKNAAMSYTGQVIALVSTQSSGVRISKNFGKTWTLLSTNGTPFSVAMSASGRYILAGGNLSTDFGDTFTYQDGLPTTSITGTSVSANGQYMIVTNAGTGYYSVDYGKTWTSRGTSGSNTTNGTCVAMTANASFVIQATTTGIYKYTSFSAINASSLDISGSTNMSGNLALTKAPSSTMGSFDLSAVNMSVFNVSEKFTNVTLSATPTLDYSTGGIFYMPGVNAALTTISITNVPTTLNRSISVTLILAQTGGSGTFCFTTGTLNINGTSVTYLKPDATALAAPSAARSIIINQFIIIWASATPTVIAYLSSMGV